MLAFRGSVFGRVLPGTRANFSSSSICCTRFIKEIKQIPEPSAQIPDVKSFFEVIGRNLTEHHEAFESWDHLFKSNGKSLAKVGLNPRDRKYTLLMLDKFRKGLPVSEIKRGKKSWGGERKRNTVKAEFLRQKRAEEKDR